MTTRQYAASLMMPVNPGCAQLVQAIQAVVPAVHAGLAAAADDAGERVTGRVVLDVHVAPPWIHRRWRSVDVLGSATTTRQEESE